MGYRFIFSWDSIPEMHEFMSVWIENCNYFNCKLLHDIHILHRKLLYISTFVILHTFPMLCPKNSFTVFIWFKSTNAHCTAFFPCLLHYYYTCSLIVIYEMITHVVCVCFFTSYEYPSCALYRYTLIQKVVKKMLFLRAGATRNFHKAIITVFFSSIPVFHFRFHSIWFWNVCMHNHKHIHTAHTRITSTWLLLLSKLVLEIPFLRGIRHVTYVKLATAFERENRTLAW